MTVAEYKASLPVDRQRLLAKEVDSLITEARVLARAVIRVNEAAALGLGKLLIEKGELDGAEIEAYYRSLPQPIISDVRVTMADRWAVSQTRARFSLGVRNFLGQRQSVEPELRAGIPKPERIADPNVIHHERMVKARGQASLARTLELVDSKSARCQAKLLPETEASE